MIRKASYADIPDLCELLREFSLSVSDEGMDGDVMEDNLVKLVDHGVVLVSDNNGVHGVIIGTFLYNPFWRSTMLQEVVWYARDNSGVGLLRAFVKAAKESNAEQVFFTVLEPAIDERMLRLLTRMGFDAVERSFIKKL